ncbi:hypothetical protein I204_05042 [Kwoniella mangroviensis CBS 8886]|uniref:uncharacterized protein n=1 Tax=Kwoniella mangroviensis CBS 8507 TaxID=1296122 RepID=UPI00080D34C4|nr:uncharacterized protein I203_00903 [Kwoniella mangroviensis CBS 8507]OCF70766.1 hypothetical protein I203_00903 [Kwoniella mangroviensis CBS 8507]OCF74662.1 hypothetical protein I204_05042 [Kwoniella mangroviensis CBS 8886]
MAHRKDHDTYPPPNWPEGITYLTKPRLSPTFPPQLIPLISPNANPNSKTFTPRPIKHPSNVHIKRIDQDGHPAKGQCGLFAKSKIKNGELIIPYIGIIHSTIIPDDLDQVLPEQEDEHSSSDYDLSLLRLSSSDIRNPFPGMHISIGVDAARKGNAARFVNDYRGLPGITGPNAEFRLGSGESGELRMEIWSLKCGVGKGEEIRVSYGKGWWGARKG